MFVPQSVAVDGSGNVYVANSENSGSVTVYAARAADNVRPIRHLGGVRTAMQYPVGLALDNGGNI